MLEMSEFIRRENIRRFEAALKACTDPREEALLRRLIAEEAAKLQHAQTKPPERP